MFKKRNTVSKRVDLQQILSGINIQNNEMDVNVDMKPKQSLKNDVKKSMGDVNESLMDIVQEQNERQGRIGRKRRNNEQQKIDVEQQRKQMLDCFQELRKEMQKTKQVPTKQIQFSDPTSLMEQDHQQYNPFVSRNQHNSWNVNVASKAPPVIHETIIEDDSGQIIEVHEDYGYISSDDKGSQDNEDNYENQIIKKTLKKDVYEKLAKSLNEGNIKQRKSKLMKQLGGLSFSDVQRRINRDLGIKKQKSKNLNEENESNNKKIKDMALQMKIKKKENEIIKEELDKVQRVIEMLYYYGEELSNFHEKSKHHFNYEKLVQLSKNEEEPWLKRIDQLRGRIKVEYQRNQEKKQAKNIKFNLNGTKDYDDEDKSDGEVEEIPKHKGREWADEWDQQREQKDDDCVQIDDD